jgi:D-sedoheptulose 7-phosphate isomerase
MQSLFRFEFSQAQQVLQDFLKQESVFENLTNIADCMITAIKNGNKIIACGNGGSMTDAMHFAEELCGKFRNERRALPAIAISDPAFISCVANDFGYDHVFARFVEGMGNSGDVLLAISTSGNSENVLQAVAVAQQKGMPVVALTGKTGGELLNQTHLGICVPHTGYADRIQEIHIKIIHTLIHVIEHELIEK